MAAIDAINAGNDALTYIGPGAIVTSRVATNLITSTNYSYSSGNFSNTGTFIDLASSLIRTQGFSVNSAGNAFFRGDISAATGNFAGNVIVGGFIRSSGATGLDAGSAGFYMAQDGQFRFGNTQASGLPSLIWDNNTLSIKGKIQTDNSLVSEIGNWRVVEGNFQDSDASIILNANSKVISISEGDIQRVVIKQGTISDPAGAATTVTIDPPATLGFTGEQLGTGYYNYNVISQTFGSSFNVPNDGVYTTIGNLNWGGYTGLSVETNYFFDGNLNLEIIGEIWDSSDLSGTQLTSVTLSNMYVASSGYSANFVFNGGYASSIYFAAAGTYYMHVKVVVEGFVQAGLIEFQGSADANSQTFESALDQTELGRDGILVAASSANYARIQRTTSNPIIDIKTNGSTPGLRITNTNASATSKAIEILAGDLSLSGA
jgi:hypothetical protein